MTTLPVIALLFVATTATSQAQTQITLGRYVRIDHSSLFQAGGQEQGVLQVRSASSRRAIFDLELSWTQRPQEDAAAVSLGEIHAGVALRQGGRWTFKSQDADDTCQLKMDVTGDRIVVQQVAKCVLFGLRVDASGTYVRAPSDAVVLVR